MMHTIMVIALVFVGAVLAFVLLAVRGYKNNAAELDRLRTDLERQVCEQTQSIRAARDDAEFASRAKSEFLSSMSHELRTPLNAIMGFAQLLDMDARKKKDDSNYTESVNQILGASTQLLELIEQLLDMSSVETGEFVVALEEVAVAPVIDECINDTEGMAERLQVTVNRAASPDWNACVHADTSMVRQALKNLLSNAIKYNTVGGTVTVMCEVIDLGRVRVSVSDSGQGIPAAVQDQVFQPFTRLGQEGSAIAGTGTGLALTKSLVMAMGGKVDFISKEGEGSTFWVELPRVMSDAPQGAKSETLPIEKKSDEPNLVLYVEDSPANATLMEHYFERIDNVDLVIAITGEDGLDVAFARSPDLILMDVNLPGISGAEAMMAVRKSEGRIAQTPIIALSADAMPDEISKALKAGFDAYLTKPIKLETLKAKLGQYLTL